MRYSHPLAMNSATITTLITAIGRKTFQPSFIRMSYFRRGMVQRTQTKTKRQAGTLRVKKIIVSSDDHHVPGSCQKGMSHPPKKRGTVRAEMAAIDMYSDMKKRANFIDEYSVWYPATSSASASAKSNGRRVVSAKADTMKTIIDSHMAGEKQFHDGIRIVSKRTKTPRCELTTSVRRGGPATSSAETADSVSASSYEIIWAEARMPPKSENLFADDHPATARP